LPQQAVSPSPGILFFATPDMDDGADSSFLTFPLPQLPQTGFPLSAIPVSISLVFPQSIHSYSYKGIVSSFFFLRLHRRYPSGQPDWLTLYNI
jgi:hypothetical protein